jgi:hypothetical protein
MRAIGLNRRELSRLALALLTAGSLTCGGDSSNPSPTPTTLAMVGGKAQNGDVGQPLADSLVVKVTDDGGDPIAGVDVTWSAEGGGSVSETSVTTGADGLAAVERVLGSTAGEVTTTATASGLEGSPVTFVATAVAPSTPRLGIKTQPSTSATSGTALEVQPAIQLEDGDGNPVADANVDVTASLASGDGTLGGTSTVKTDGSGVATFTDLAITGPAGSYVFRFTSPGRTQVLANPITLGSSGGGSSVTITTNPPTSALDGEVFDPSVQPVVLVKDGSSNLVSGATVTAALVGGSGTLDGTLTATTDANGSAAFGDLGITGPGSYTISFTSGTGSVTSGSININPLPAEASTGKWDPPVPWDIVPLHMHLLPTGKILAWGKLEMNGSMGLPRLWDPSSGAPSGAPIAATGLDTMLFCAGHAFMPDGRLLVSGGHKADDRGLDVTNIFDPASETWVAGLPKMAAGRWYPTVTTLPDGRVLTMAGRDTTQTVVKIPEVWNGTSWTQLTGISVSLPYYPRNFVAPDGRVFYAGERVTSRWFTVTGAGSSTAGPVHRWPFQRDYGSAVMYDTGKILYVGGGGDPSATGPKDATSSTPTSSAEIIDINQASPSWSFTDSMAVPRRHLNATTLPDGQVLVTGGTSGGGADDLSPGNATHAAEIWNPKNGHWTTLASNAVVRVYHSVSILLPDGTVLHGASGDAEVPGGAADDQRSHEIFHPPYLYKGAQPTITNAPANVGYGQAFTVATPNAAQITEVRWIRLGSVTHAFDENARANTLTFSKTTDGVSVTAPENSNLAPPGHYLLFILNRNSVPSVGKVVKIQ